MEHTDAARRDEGHQLLQERHAVGWTQALEDSVTVHEVEHRPAASRGAPRREQLAGCQEFDVTDTATFRLVPRGIEHGGRAVNGRHPAWARRKRQGQAPHAAPVLERRERRKLRHQPLVDDPPHPGHVFFAAGEKRTLGLGRQIGAKELGGREHGKVGLASRERFPPRIR